MANKKQGDKSYHAHIARVKAVRYIVLILLTLICLFSFYVLFVNSTRAHYDIQKGFSALPGGYIFKNFNSVIHNGNLPVIRCLINSLIVSAGTAICTTYSSCLTAYSIHAYDFKGRKALQTFIMAVMMIPTQVTALGFVDLMRTFRLTDNFIPLIVPAIAAPAVYFFMKQYMEGSLPLEIVEAARIDGSSEFRTFNSIVIPIMKPAIAVQAIFAFVSSWNNYFTPNLIISKDKMKTLPILIATLRGADFLKFDMGQVYMCILLAVLPVIVVYVFLSRYIIQGVAVGSVKG
ncbi:MAG: carbohydrate ABC transporter permease [Lachnospiraceae bacterium]|nr:carbohydrate ABC transporter permease [Lachnospiraceae bacterium]